jgi:hypothetical protein
VKLKRLLEIPPQTAAEFVQELGQVARESAADPQARLPLVTLGLKSGRTVTGHILNTSRTSLSLASAQDGHAAAGENITFLAIEAVETITSPSFREVTAEHPVPGKLELKRRAESLGQELSLRIDLPALSDEDLRAIADALSHCATVLKNVLQDPMGKDAMHSRIKFVELGLGKQTVDIWQNAVDKLL